LVTPFGPISIQLTRFSSVTDAFASSLPVGINPFWKLSFVFKCLTDSVVLDDFKTALDRLHAFKFNRAGSFATDGLAERGGSHPKPDFGSWAGLAKTRSADMYTPSPDAEESSQKPWSNLGSDVTYVEHSKKKDGGRIEEEEMQRMATNSSSVRPESTSADDSADIAYAQALREVSRSSQGDGHQQDQEEDGSQRKLR
jgi:hypothetical protein